MSNIFSTFYLLFKTDSGQAAKDVAELDKKVDNLRQTGKKQGEQQQKDTKESTKQLKDYNESLKETGSQYVKIAEGVAQATAATISFGSIAKGIFGTAGINSNLEVQSKLLGQSAVDIKAYGAAVQAAGGSSSGFGAHIQELFERFSALGLNLPKIDDVLQKYRDILKQTNGNPAQQELAFQRLNIQDPGLKSLLLESDEDYKRDIQLQKQLAQNTQEGAVVAREFSKEWAVTGAALDSVFTTIGQDVLPVFITINKDLQDFFGYLKDNKGLAELVFGGAATGVTLLSGVIISSLIPALGTLAAVSSVALAPLAIIGGAAGIGTALYKYSSTHGFNSPTRAQLGNSPLSRREQDLAFWQSQGYSREQASAWVAAAQAESGGNPNAIGDGGQARGLFQWHPDRQAAILRGTGIDVTTASYDDQLKAAAWEAEQRGDAARIKSAKTAAEAAAIHTQYFERPTDVTGESIRRGQYALDIAQNTPFSSVSGGSNKSISVKTGDIHVYSQASDATGIAKDTASELEKQINLAIANMDDGVKY